LRGTHDDDGGVRAFCDPLKLTRREVAGDDLGVGYLQALGAGEFQQRVPRVRAQADQLGAVGAIKREVRKHRDQDGRRTGGIGRRCPSASASSVRCLASTAMTMLLATIIPLMGAGSDLYALRNGTCQQSAKAREPGAPHG
jgi:hypothetical protein